jgi:hypothetical protein
MITAILVAAALAAAPQHGQGVRGFGVYHWGMTVDEVLAANKKAPAHRAEGKVGPLRVLAASTAVFNVRSPPLGEQFLFDGAGKLRAVVFFHGGAEPGREVPACADMQHHFENLWGGPTRIEHTPDHVTWKAGWELGPSQAELNCSVVEGKRLMNLSLYERGHQP